MVDPKIVETLYGEGVRVSGPYFRRDGRQHVILMSKTLKRTVSYPKLIVECRLGRRLAVDETIDHIDCDVLNNSEANLRILPRAVHSSVDARKLPVKELSCVCVLCEHTFVASVRRLRDAALKRKAGPFCSRRCAGIYGASVQNGQTPLPGQSKPQVFAVKDKS